MITYMKRHEQYVRTILNSSPSPQTLAGLLARHETQIIRMQHERLVHLITMLFVCLFFLLSFGWAITHFSAPYLALSGLLMVLAAAYILHYYRLENAVQAWYRLSDEIREKLPEGVTGRDEPGD
jgi:hypothetical protein